MSFPWVLATTNENKQKEWNDILELLPNVTPIRVQILKERRSFIELQSNNPAEVALTKAIDARYRCKRPVLVEDVAFSLVGLGDFPGVYYNYVESTIGREGILDLADRDPNRRARVTMTIAFVTQDDRYVNIVQIQEEGTVPKQVSGEGGFGWDPLFIPMFSKKTYAQMAQAEKNGCSFRRKAIEALVKGEWIEHVVSASPLALYLQR